MPYQDLEVTRNGHVAVIEIKRPPNNFFDNSRWDYVYTLRVPGYVDDQMQMSLFFTDGVLSHFTGDYKPTDAEVEGAAEAPPSTERGR